MALRLQGGGYSHDGTAWDVYLYGPGTGVINAHLGEDIVTIRYDGNDLDINAAIIPSSASIVIKAKNQSEIDANEALLSEIALAGEGEFILKIYRNSALNWVGLVLADQIQFSVDRLPRPLTIRAVDGLARLKEIEYNKDGTEFGIVSIYLSQHIIACLQKTGLFQELSPGLKASTNWTCAENTYSSFLEGIRLSQIVWLYIDEKGASQTTTQKRSKTAWQVLEEIARLFHARVFMSQGSFWFVQVSVYDSPISAVTRIFDENGATTGSSITSLPVCYQNTRIQKMGASWEYQPAIKRVKVTYRHASAKNVAIELNFISGPVIVEGIDSFSGTGKIYISFILTYPTELDPTTYPVYFTHAHKFRLTVKIGNYYLRRTSTINLGQIIYSDPEWTTTTSDYEFYVNPSYSFNGKNRYNFDLLTPPLPASGDGQLNLHYVHTWFLGNSTTQQISSFTWFVTNGNFQVIPQGLIDEAYNETTYTQESEVVASKQIEIVSTFGDGPYSYTLTTMKARRAEGTPPPITQTWTGVGKTGTVHQVLAAAIIKYTGKVAKKLNLPFINGAFDIISLLEDEGLFYLMVSGDYTARTNEWNGVFVQVPANSNGVTLPPKKYLSEIPRLKDVFVPPTRTNNPIPSDGVVSASTFSIGDSSTLRATVPTITTTPIDAGTITSIPVDTIGLAKVFKAGDKIRVTDIKTGKGTTFTVSSDNAAGATSISVTSQTITDKITDASPVQLDPEYLYTRTGGGSFIIAGNSGTPNPIDTGETLTINGRTAILAQAGTNQIDLDINITGLSVTPIDRADSLLMFSSILSQYGKNTIASLLALHSFNIAADSGSANAIKDTETFTIEGGNAVLTTVSTNKIKVDVDITELTSAIPATGDSLMIYDISDTQHKVTTIGGLLALHFFNIAADLGTANPINNSETFTIEGGDAIVSTVSTNKVRVDVNITELPSATPVSSDSILFFDLSDNAHKQATLADLAPLFPTKVYGVKIISAGLDSNGEHVVNHSLGTTNIVVTAIPNDSATVAVIQVKSITTTTVTLTFRDFSGALLAFATVSYHIQIKY